MQLGLVTYMWGAQWDLPTLIKNLSASGFKGAELRTGHKHGVEPSLATDERRRVGDLFRASGLTLVGVGTACEYHSPDPKVVQKNIEETKAFIELVHDCGGGGVKVRPNGLPKEVPVEKTLEQIGKAIREVAEYGDGFGVPIRLEVHGKGTNEVPHIKTIMDVADHENATVCWNCNPSDSDGAGFKANFDLVKNKLGTIHIHDLNSSYPWKELFALLKQCEFNGWTLLEEGKVPSDPVVAMQAYRVQWEKMTS